MILHSNRNDLSIVYLGDEPHILPEGSTLQHQQERQAELLKLANESKHNEQIVSLLLLNFEKVIRQYVTNKKHRIKHVSGVVTLLIEKLIKIQNRLASPDVKKDLIDQLRVSSAPNTNEFDSLIGFIINTAYEEGFEASDSSFVARSAANGRRQIRINSDNQARKLMPLIDEIRTQGITTYLGIADELNNRKIATKNGNQWYASSVKILLEKIEKVKHQPHVHESIDEFTQTMIPVINALRTQGADTTTEMAKALNSINVKTKSGKTWYPNTVRLLLLKIDKFNKVNAEIAE